MPDKREFQDIIIDNIIESLPVGLAVIDSEGQIVVLNQALSTMLGFSKEALTEEGWGALFFETTHNSEFNEIIIDVIQQEEVRLSREVSYRRRDGTTLRLAIISSFLRDGENIAGVVVLVQDITEEYLFDLREKHALEERNRIQQERAESLRNLADNVAHQIRNPVMSIAGFANLALKRIHDDEKMSSFLEAVRDQAATLDRVVKAVAEFSSLEVSTMQKHQVRWIFGCAHTRCSELAETMEKTCDVLSTVQDNPDGSPLLVYCDANMMCRALEELIANALEFSNADQPLVTFTATRQGGYIVMKVTDNGNGIPPENLPYVFDPFYTTKPNAVGFGLTNARRIAQEHGGRIIVENSDKEGTVARIEIPESPQQETVEPDPAQARDAAATPTA